jgi:hypothetical protein
MFKSPKTKQTQTTLHTQKSREPADVNPRAPESSINRNTVGAADKILRMNNRSAHEIFISCDQTQRVTVGSGSSWLHDWIASCSVVLRRDVCCVQVCVYVCVWSPQFCSCQSLWGVYYGSVCH